MTARPWVKVRLSEGSDSVHALEIIQYWTRLRQCAFHVMRAVRMYYALTQGDDGLLREYFPLLSVSSSRPAIAYNLHQPVKTPAKVEAKARTEEEDKADLLDGLF